MAFSFQSLVTNPFINPVGALLTQAQTQSGGGSGTGILSGGTKPSGGVLSSNLSATPTDVGDKGYDDGLTGAIKGVSTTTLVIVGVVVLVIAIFILRKKRQAA